jgi:hypothetical protein
MKGVQIHNRVFHFGSQSHLQLKLHSSYCRRHLRCDVEYEVNENQMILHVIVINLIVG